MPKTKLVDVKLGDKTIKMQPKHLRFCDEYLIDLNGTQAYIRAGYSTKGAAQSASKLLTNTKVRAYIDYHLAMINRRCGVSADRIVRELACLAFVNAADVINLDTATIKEDATEQDLRAIQSVKVKIIPVEGGNIIEREIKIADKKGSLEMLGKRDGMWTEKVEMDTEVTVKMSVEMENWAK